MNKFFGVIAATTLLVGGAVPALAQMDVAAMTCGAYFDMDAAGRAEGANAVQNFVKDTANHTVAGPAAQLLATSTQEEVIQAIEAACEGQTVETNLMSVLK
jgi:uncharacterized protein YgbK (DUF1537 family)